MKEMEFISMLDKNPELKKDLFIKGFLITDKKLDNLLEFPFYGNWSVREVSGYYFMAHELAGMHIYETGDGNVFFIMGHAYNPFTKEYEESRILEHISVAYGSDDYMERVNDITGVFIYGSIVKGKLEYLVDPSGMQSACYGKIGGGFLSFFSPSAYWGYMPVGNGCLYKRTDTLQVVWACYGTLSPM